jgi:hypothetical protein
MSHLSRRSRRSRLLLRAPLAGAVASLALLPAFTAPASAAPVKTIKTSTGTLKIYNPKATSVRPSATGKVGGAAAPKSTHLPAKKRKLQGLAAGGAKTPATPATPAASPTPVPAAAKTSPASRAPARVAAQRSGGLSSGAIALAAIAGLVALACAAWGVARMRAFEPHWMLSARHVVSEAGFRASSTWAEFSDWIRVGH